MTDRLPAYAFVHVANVSVPVEHPPTHPHTPYNRLPNHEVLLLEENEIGNAGARRLAKALERCGKLSVLKLTQNEIRRCVLYRCRYVCMYAGRAFCFMDRSSFVRSVLFPSIPPPKINTRTGALAVVAAFINRDGAALLQPSKLKLELNANEISEGGVQEIGALLEGKGLGGVLGEMDDCEGDDDEEEYEEEEEEDGEAAEGLDDLIAGVEKVKV